MASQYYAYPLRRDIPVPDIYQAHDPTPGLPPPSVFGEFARIGLVNLSVPPKYAGSNLAGIDVPDDGFIHPINTATAETIDTDRILPIGPPGGFYLAPMGDWEFSATVVLPRASSGGYLFWWRVGYEPLTVDNRALHVPIHEDTGADMVETVRWTHRDLGPILDPVYLYAAQYTGTTRTIGIPYLSARWIGQGSRQGVHPGFD